MNLREMIDTAMGLTVDVKQPRQSAHAFAVKDQVIVRRPVGFSGATTEIISGEILAFADNGKSAVVSFPRAGGVLTRATVDVDQLQPASSVYRRGRVHVNPAFRGQM